MYETRIQMIMHHFHFSPSSLCRELVGILATSAAGERASSDIDVKPQLRPTVVNKPTPNYGFRSWFDIHQLAICLISWLSHCLLSKSPCLQKTLGLIIWTNYFNVICIKQFFKVSFRDVVHRSSHLLPWIWPFAKLNSYSHLTLLLFNIFLWFINLHIIFPFH